MRFNHENVKKVMPDDTVYVTIMREPGRLFQSTFAYMRQVVPAFSCYQLDDENAAEKWLSNPDKCIQAAKGFRNLLRYEMFQQNHMAFDLGFDYAMKKDEEIANAIKKIDSIFDLVLITDYMEESLVLLSSLLCLSLEEVASLKIHERQNTNFIPNHTDTDRRISKMARSWNKADAAFFDYFNATLWRKIEAFGVERMSTEVAKLRKINQKQSDLCLDDKSYTSSNSSDPNQSEKFWETKSYEPLGVVLKHHYLKENAKNIKECTYLVGSPKGFTQYAFQVQNRTKQFKNLRQFDKAEIKKLRKP